MLKGIIKATFTTKCVLAGLLIATPDIFGQGADTSKYVYKIRITSNRSQGYEIQTGFQLRGIKGIVTALHGVAGAKGISAIGSKDNFSNLKIVKVDINNDIALLLSPELQNKSAEGLEPADSGQVAPRAQLTVVGYPQGIGQYNKSVQA